jgi:threonine dehydrogenase-like Zn-dependent dehydrogenase
LISDRVPQSSSALEAVDRTYVWDAVPATKGWAPSPAPVRYYLPDMIELVLKGEIDPGKVFHLTLPLDQVAEGYRAMDERRAIKTLLMP